MFVGVGIGVGRQRFAGSFDADYQAVLNYAISIGATLPSSEQQTKQNQLLLDLKSAGIWNRLDTFAMFATDGSSSFALIDWKRLVTYTAVNSPTFSTNGGFTGNGTSSHINTNLNPFIGGFNYVRDNASRSFWVDNRGTTGQIFEGLVNANNNGTFNDNTTAQQINSGTNMLLVAVNMASDGFKSINRNSSTAITIFNTTTQSTGVATSGALGNGNQVILRRNALYGAHRFRFYSMGSNLISQNTDYYNAINTYLTSL